jgi:hypothetical protein
LVVLMDVQKGRAAEKDPRRMKHENDERTRGGACARRASVVTISPLSHVFRFRPTTKSRSLLPPPSCCRLVSSSSAASLRSRAHAAAAVLLACTTTPLASLPASGLLSLFAVDRGMEGCGYTGTTSRNNFNVWSHDHRRRRQCSRRHCCRRHQHHTTTTTTPPPRGHHHHEDDDRF